MGKTKPVALITGASRGIGKAVAYTLAQNNFKLALLARDRLALEALTKELDLEEKDILILDADVTDNEKIKNAVDVTVKYFNGVDVAILNHGVYVNSLFNGNSADWRNVINVNLLSSMYFTELLLPYLTNSSSKYKGLIFTASIASHTRFAGGAAYCTSKHGLLGFAHCIFEEVRETGLKVCAICPGFVNTDMIAGDNIDRAKTIQPDDIASIVYNTLTMSSTVCPVEIIVRPQHSPHNKSG